MKKTIQKATLIIVLCISVFASAIFVGCTNKADNTSQSEKTNISRCIFTIECKSVLDNMDNLDKDKHEFIPDDGFIIKEQTVEFNDGDSAFDILQKVCKDNNIHLETSWSPMYNTHFIEGINNLYNSDCGDMSGWMFLINGKSPNYGCSECTLSNGDTVKFKYSCDIGKDTDSE